MLQGIGEPLLQDPVGGQVEAGGSGRRLAWISSSTSSPAARTPSTRASRSSSPGCGSSSSSSPSRRMADSRRRISVRAVRPASSALSNAARSVHVRLRHPVPNGSHLKNHHTDGVRHDIVQFASDAAPLLGHRDACRRLSFSLGAVSPFDGGHGLLSPTVQGEADEPADHEQRRGEGELSDGAFGVVEHDDGRCGQQQDEPASRAVVVAQVSQQKSGAHPGEEHPGLRHDQLGRPGTTGPRSTPTRRPERRRGSDDAGAG